MAWFDSAAERDDARHVESDLARLDALGTERLAVDAMHGELPLVHRTGARDHEVADVEGYPELAVLANARKERLR